MQRTFAFLFLVTLAISSCKKEVTDNIDQNKIWTFYELFYNQNTNTTHAKAVFRFSNSTGSVLQLSNPSKVLFNNELLPWNEENGTYEAAFSGAILTGTFEWTDTEGKIYTNTVEIREVAYGPLPDTLYKDMGGNQFIWNGDVVAQDERMVLTLNGTGESDTRVFSVDTINANSITLDSNQLTQITSGNVTLFFDRIFSPQMQEETERGGTRMGRFRPTDEVVFLADSL